MASEIIISNPQAGMGASAYVGFDEIRGLNINDKTGAAFPNRALTKESGSVVEDLIEGYCIDDNSRVYTFTQENFNKVYKLSSGTWTELSGFTNSPIYGIAFWKGYIILIHSNGNMDASGDDGATWTNSFDTITSSSAGTNPTIVSRQNGNLYIGNEYYVERLEEVTGKTFDPTDNTTWTLTNGNLDLPSDYEITHLAELGNNLVMACDNRTNDAVSDIFSWNYSDVSSFDVGPRIWETRIRSLLSINNLLYIQGSGNSNWYVSNGVSVQRFARIPRTLVDLSTLKFDMWNRISFYYDGRIYFGLGSNNTDVYPAGVYSLDINTKVLNLEQIISTGNDGTLDAVWIGALIPPTGVTFNYRVCWYDENESAGSKYGVDDLGSARYTDDKAYMVSQFIRVGTTLASRTFSDIQIELTKPMVSGDSVKIAFRTAQNGAWTHINTWNTVGDQSLYVEWGEPELKDVQFKITLNGEAEFIEARIK